MVNDHDRVMMAMLKFLGIEKGKPFNPDERKKKILTEAALVGEAMAKANTFEKRLDGAYFRFYAPTEPYFERSWPLPDIERIGN